MKQNVRPSGAGSGERESERPGVSRRSGDDFLVLRAVARRLLERFHMRGRRPLDPTLLAPSSSRSAPAAAAAYIDFRRRSGKASDG